MNGFRKVALFGALTAVATVQAAWVKEEKLWEMNFTPAEMRGLERKLVKGNSYAPEEGKDGALHCLSTNKVGTRNFSMPLDLSRIAGPILVEARVKGHNVERGTRFYCGPNLMIHYTNPPGSRKMEAWRKLANEFGTFDWKTWTLVDIIPSDVANLQMVVVLQECRGELWVDDITIWRAKEIPDDNVKPPASNPRADAIPRGRWAGKVRPGARRGVMSGHDLSEDAFRTLQSWGANLIRLQTGVGRKELERGADYFQAFSNRLDELAVHLDRCRRYGLKACIDLHSGPQAERTKHASNFIPADYDTTLLRRAWRMIATRFRDHPAVYGYDILNEPSCATETWQRIFAEVVADIRTIDAKTPVITESLAKYYPPEMNVIYSPHFYSPHVLTHYGVGTQWKIRWGYLNYINGEWWDKDQLRIAMQKYIDFSLAHPDARLYIGEFSCIAWVKNADAYIRDCTELFNEYGWDWTYHAFREWQPWDVEYEPAELYDTTVGHLRKAKTDTKRKEALLHGLRGATGPDAQSQPDGLRYENPVVKTDSPDPTVWKGDDGFYYAASTHQDVLRSPDLVHWTKTGHKLLEASEYEWIAKSWPHVWAPDVVKIGDWYNLYICFHNRGEHTAVAVYRSKNPAGPFTDREILVRSEEDGRFEVIDPETVVDPDTGRVWLFFGHGCVRRVELTADGRHRKEGAKIDHVAGLPIGGKKEDAVNGWKALCTEGAYLHRRGGKWYLFVSEGSWNNHTYRVSVGRGDSLEGTFVDKAGNPMTRGAATPILTSEEGDAFFGPGHNGEIFTTPSGRTYMFYHCHWADSPAMTDGEANVTVGSKYVPRPLFLQEILWGEDGWPYFENNGKPQKDCVLR